MSSQEKNSMTNGTEDLTITKTADKQSISAGDIVTVTTVVVNNTADKVYDIDVYDDISEGLSFVEDSFVYNYIPFLGFDPTLGFSIGGPLSSNGGSVQYSYKLLAQDDMSKISQIELITTASVEIQGSYQDFYSNQLILKVINLINDVTMLKSASKLAVKTGDQVTYTITISNHGDFDNTNIFFIDSLPSQVQFVPNSVKIDGVLQPNLDVTQGFNLSDLEQNKSIVVQFDVMVK